MTETVVHVTTLEQWKSVLDVWFAQGYYWITKNEDYSRGRFKEYYYEAFRDGCRQLAISNENFVYFYGKNSHKGKTIEYAEFMAQQEKTMTKETYYVTKEQLYLIEKIKNCAYPADEIANRNKQIRNLVHYWDSNQDKALLRYLGGDTSIEFKLKEPLYRLWRIDDDRLRVYMKFGISGTPTYTSNENSAFTAPREEIEKHKTVSWEIEKAD